MATGEQLFNWNEAGHFPIFADAADFAPESPDIGRRKNSGDLTAGVGAISIASVHHTSR